MIYRYKKLLCFLAVLFFLITAYLFTEPLYTPTAIAVPNYHNRIPKVIVVHPATTELKALASSVQGIEIDLTLSSHTNTQHDLARLEKMFKQIGSQKYIFLNMTYNNFFNKTFCLKLSDLIQKYHLESTVIIESFNPFLLVRFRLINRDLQLLYKFATSKTNQIPWLLKQPFVQKQIRRIVRPDILGPKWDTDTTILKKLARQGYPMIAWTVDEINIAEKMFNLGIKGLQTNQPLTLLTLTQKQPDVVFDAGGSSNIVSEIYYIKSEQDLKTALNKAKTLNKKMTIAGRRHSMGGQTLLNDSIHLDMLGLNHVHYHPETKTMTVGAGATWQKIQHILNQHHRSVKVMQSDNIFTVGGSISANVHGWQVGSPPIVDTLIAMKVMMANGEILQLTPKQHPNLFNAIVGGYGQLGIIIEAEIETVENSLVQFNADYIKPNQFLKTYQQRISNNPKAELAYGRLSVDPNALFNEAGLFWYEQVKTQAPTDEPIQPEPLVAFKRSIFRASQYFDLGKQLRWWAEKLYAKKQQHSDRITRNNAMNTDIHILWPLYGHSKDILHEYFIPKKKLNDFIEMFKQYTLEFNMNILNVTIREVLKDEQSMLAYAKEDMFGLVCLFSQQETPFDETHMILYTQKLINAALEMGGTFYLPYRLHYTKNQLHTAYPGLSNWMHMKKKWDPDNRFYSQFMRYIEHS